MAVAGARALVPSAQPVASLRVELPEDGSIDPDLLDMFVRHSPVDPGSRITGTRWTGRAIEVDIEADGPRVIVLVDDHGHTSVVRLSGSGTAKLSMQHGLAAAPPFTVVVLAARGPSFALDAKTNVSTKGDYAPEDTAGSR